MRTERGKGINAILFAAVAAILLISIWVYNNRLREELSFQMQDILQTVAEQNRLAIKKEILGKQSFLEGIAQQIQIADGDEKENVIDNLNGVTDSYHFKRMGFVYPDGTAYTTDGYEQDLSFRDFFQKGMEGEKYVTDIMMDVLGEEEMINVISVPVVDRESGQAEGVLFATYQTEKFKEQLNVESFNGEGYSLVVKEDGTLIADSPKSPMYGKDNIFTALAEGEDQNQTATEELTPLLKSGKGGGGSYYLNGKRYYYCLPLDINMEDGEWFIFTVVPAQVLEAKVSPVMSDINSLFAIIILVLGVAVFFYIGSYHRSKQDLYDLAYQDPLTHGDNYVCFKEKIKRKKDVSGYIISMDLSEFKIINNTCGISKGNVILKAVWDILYAETKGDELAAHINADRFILYLEDADKEQLEIRLQKLISKISGLSESMNVPRVVPYFGIYHADDLSKVETNYSYASHARHQVKGRRDHNFAFYEESDFQLMLKNRSLEDGFEKAIMKRSFEVWYQPKYSTIDASIVGSEALVRWRMEDGSLISPGTFIPLFEKNGMISMLDEYVFRAVCMQQKKWMEEGKQILPVSINISRASLYYSNIVEKYKAILDEYGVDSRHIQLEITESATVDNKEIQELLDQFHMAGFQLLLDDFGNGYSSLSSLNEMHFDVLKLDKSLIDHIGDSNGEKLLYHIVNLVKSLGLKITAEGVESKEQVGFLQKLRCNDIQGFYFSRPLPYPEYEKLL